MQDLKEKGTRGTPDFPFETYIYDVMSSGFTTTELHWHPEIELLLVEKGEITVYVGEEKLIVKAGEICFINPEELHSICTHSKFVEYDAAVFLPSLVSYGSEHFFDQSFVQPLTESKICFPRIISAENYCYEDILPLAEAMFNPFSSKTAVLSCIMGLFCALIDNDLMEANPRSCNHNHYNDIKLCIDYMNRNFHQKLKLSQLAELIHISPNYFCNYFKDYTGTSAFSYLNSIRVKKACTLLTTGNDTIANIAKNCGFENMSFFIKKFKEVVGCTPSAYRKEAKHNTMIL